MGCTQSQCHAKTKTEDLFWHKAALLAHHDHELQKERNGIVVVSTTSTAAASHHLQHVDSQHNEMITSLAMARSGRINSSDMDSGHASTVSGSVSTNGFGGSALSYENAPNHHHHHRHDDGGGGWESSSVSIGCRDAAKNEARDTRVCAVEPHRRFSAVVRRPTCFSKSLRATSWQYGELWYGRDAGTPIEQLFISHGNEFVPSETFEMTCHETVDKVASPEELEERLQLPVSVLLLDKLEEEGQDGSSTSELIAQIRRRRRSFPVNRPGGAAAAGTTDSSTEDTQHLAWGSCARRPISLGPILAPRPDRSAPSCEWTISQCEMSISHHSSFTSVTSTASSTDSTLSGLSSFSSSRWTQQFLDSSLHSHASAAAVIVAAADGVAKDAAYASNENVHLCNLVQFDLHHWDEFSASNFSSNFYKRLHKVRKQEMRDMKMLQKVHKKEFQEQTLKMQLAREQQAQRFALEIQNLQNKMSLEQERAEREAAVQLERLRIAADKEMRVASQRLRQDQDRSMSQFKEEQRKRRKLADHELDLEVLPLSKEQRRDTLRIAREEHKKREREEELAYQGKLLSALETFHFKQRMNFLEQEASLQRRLLRDSQARKELYERLRLEVEEKQLIERNTLLKRQLSEFYIMVKTQLLQRHERERQHYLTIQKRKEDQLIAAHAAERKRLPKVNKNEQKTRMLMFRQSLFIIAENQDQLSPEKERDKIREFELQEEERRKAAQSRLDQKHRQQRQDMQRRHANQMTEIECIQNEKRVDMQEEETMKLKDLNDSYQTELVNFRENLKRRKQAFDESMVHELETLESQLSKHLTEERSQAPPYLSELENPCEEVA